MQEFLIYVKVEKTKLEMLFLVDVERKKTETNKQIIHQAFLESQDLLNEANNKKLAIIQQQNEGTLQQIIQNNQQEIIKLHKYYEQQIEKIKQQYASKEEEEKFNYQNSLQQLKIQIQTNFEYQLEQYRQQFLRERNEINERHTWDIQRIKEKNEQQIKIIFDRLSREYDTKMNDQLYQLTSSYECKIDQLKQQLTHIEQQRQVLDDQLRIIQKQNSDKIEKQERTYSNASVQASTLLKDQDIQTEQYIHMIEPLYCTNYEEIITKNNQLKQLNFDLTSQNQDLKANIQFLEQLVNKYQNLFD
ncbi:unnamed protein product (macronuclear) [Paramecium tetraurelia]|uniref:Uncharacterized protein n=1 Tax=Paramecium tetraurelia TaxID=5888 RepID=A0D3Y1_PARTE|nr:uncharacterized protein GSPATT00013213001 [Paramecium tetraurelia]CAK77748.1 unnamed protein product [Paramecium tetraurelia]|eukprot:XP_001445145.1 hypothetical protein (macronuclear) [Paramecium tetraurelia strain d4-2]